MKEMVEVLAKHGYWILFVSVLGRQACLPVPANLFLLAAGALAGLGKLSFLGIVVFSLTAFLLADLAWYKADQRWVAKHYTLFQWQRKIQGLVLTR
jgi:membrane protein DedA with SNARE-associated domain